MNANSFAYLRLLHGPEKAQELLGRRLLNLDYYQLDLEDIRVLIDAGADVNAKDEDGWTPLHYVADSTCRHLEALQALIDAGADVNVKSERGVTPLHYACIDDPDLKVLQALIDAGADVNAKDEDGRAPLGEAIDSREWLTAKILVDAGANVKEAIMWCQSQFENPSLGERPLLCYAIAEMDLEFEVLQSLIDTTDINEYYAYSGWTPLHYEADRGPDLKVLQALIDAGADMHAKDWEKRTPLHIAAQNTSNPEIVRCLADFHSAHATDVYGMEPLHYAAARYAPDPEVLQVLIDAGADVGASNNGRTVMTVDIGMGGDTFLNLQDSMEIVSCLEKFSELPHKLADYFYDRGWCLDRFYCDVANNELQDFEDSLERMRNMGRYLYTGNAEGAPWDGRTPLHHATMGNSNPEVLQVLIDAGADVNAQDVYGYTPLDLAKSNKNPEISKLLISCGAKENAKPGS